MSSPAKRRVVVTGIGLVTPLGLDAPSTWAGAIEGKSGIGTISRFDASAYPVRIAAEVKGFNPEKYLSSKDVRKMGLFIQYGIAASMEALADSGLASLENPFGSATGANAVAPERVGCSISAGLGGLPEMQHWDRELVSKEKKTISPFFVPMIIPNMVSGQLSIMVNAKGPNLCIVTACASSSHAIGDSARMIERGEVDVMIAGGAEAVVCELGIAGFASMRALSTRNDDPVRSSRPWDVDRDGFVLGEGAGILVLEEFEQARKRGAKIYAEVSGFGMTADAYHMTSPAPEGVGAERCIRIALADAGVAPESIGYVNAHGTSTPAGDSLEAQAIAKVFGTGARHLHVSSTKSMTGHLLGAAGGAEAALSCLALRAGIIPPTMNLDKLDEVSAATGLDFTANEAVRKPLEAVLSNSFGFGGTNATLIFKKV